MKDFCLINKGLILVGFLSIFFSYCPFISANEERAKNDSPVKDIEIENRDSTVKISWKTKKAVTVDGQSTKGFRLYQLRDGLEVGFGIPKYKLLEDRKTDGSYTVKGLRNGEQYLFVLKAYDQDNKEFWETMLFGFPGTDSKGRPEIPKEFYTVSGDGRVAGFWTKNPECDLIGYEVYRKGPGDQDFRLVARIPKVTRLTDKKGDTKKFFQEVFSPVYLDKNVENGKSYEYKVRAMDGEGYFSNFTSVASATPMSYAFPMGSEVVLLVNSWTADSNDDGLNDSEEVARYYAKKRGVPSENIMRFKLDPNKFNYTEDVQKPLKRYLLRTGLAGTIRYIVPCYNMPLGTGNRAFDSCLADLFDRFTWGRGMGTPNPYYNRMDHFDGTYGFYLVTRLDAPTVGVAKSLVDKALYAEKNITGQSGKAYCVDDEWGKNLEKAGRKIGVAVVLKPYSFSANELLPEDAYWYFGWRHEYKKIRSGDWPPGAVGAHLISWSFSKIRGKNWQGKSWVEGLLEDGITGTFGAVVEPYLQGYTRSDLFFERFWSGEYNFAESFYMATPTLQWAMSAVGDPLFRVKKLGVNGDD